MAQPLRKLTFDALENLTNQARDAADAPAPAPIEEEQERSAPKGRLAYLNDRERRFTREISAVLDEYEGVPVVDAISEMIEQKYGSRPLPTQLRPYVNEWVGWGCPGSMILTACALMTARPTKYYAPVHVLHSIVKDFARRSKTIS